MRRPPSASFFTYLLAVIVGVLPMVNDTCGIGCDLDRQQAVMAPVVSVASVASVAEVASDAPSCPLHDPMTLPEPSSSVPTGPHHPVGRCTHDHASVRAVATLPVGLAHQADGWSVPVVLLQLSALSPISHPVSVSPHNAFPYDLRPRAIALRI